jgi:cellulose synthase/poly-beta-1,6-N-acetylglucosamine synthase-like glycosyltransferase
MLFIVYNNILLVLFLYLFALTASALARPRGPRGPAGAPRFVFVVPAHDEEGSVGATVASCKAADYDPGRFEVAVVADNCSDRTAAVARAAGAVVTERRDPSRRGKGYALSYFFDRLPPAGAPGGFDAVVVVDADAAVDPGILRAFAGALAEGKEWLQGYNAVGNPEDSRFTRLLAYSFSLFNGVWPLGQEGLGLSVPFRGNGMCLATRALARSPWRAYGLTEDVEFSWSLRLAGERVHFVPEAGVRSAMLPRRGPGAAAQRRRWEWGRMDQRRRFALPLLRAKNLGLSKKILYGIDLFFPTMSALVLALLAAAAVHVGAASDEDLVPLSRALLPVHAFMAFTLALYAVSPVVVLGLPARYLSSLFDLPAYMAWKALAVLGRKPAVWERTEREPGPSGDAPLGGARRRAAEATGP